MWSSHWAIFRLGRRAASLTVIVIPVVVRTTENMLILVPNGLREAATALGAPMSFVIRSVTWKAAQAGIVTGVLLAVARISGETAPLLFTALGNNQFDEHRPSTQPDGQPAGRDLHLRHRAL